MNEAFITKLGDFSDIFPTVKEGSVHAIITSPPYDDLRGYEGTSSDWNREKWLDFIKLAHRVLVPGGMVVWIVGDATKNGGETGSSFQQALDFRNNGFLIHDTMIWNKGGFSAVGSLKVRYGPVFEYMFCFSKGKSRYFSALKDRKNKWAGTKNHGTVRVDGDEVRPVSNCKEIAEYGHRFNVWEVPPHRQKGKGKHPAPFPTSLARDHVVSWTRPGEIVLDPMMGSGTTGVACAETNRRFIGFERVDKYFHSASERISDAYGADPTVSLI